jgi:hypothetical protein
MIYVLYQNKVLPYRNDHRPHATFQQCWFDLVDPCVSQRINRDSTFDGMFSQPFRVLLRDLQVPQPVLTIHFLSQCYGASPSSVFPQNAKLMEKCLSSDNCFQCSPVSPSLLFPNKWRLPFYQESCFLAETATRREGKANEVGKTRPGMGQYEKLIDESWKSCDTHAYARFKCNLEMDTCADCVYLVPGNHLLCSTPGLGMTHPMPGFDPYRQEPPSGHLPRLFYVPYLRIGLVPPDVRFALLELNSLRMLLSRTRTEEDHDRFLSSNSQTYVTFATINMCQHPAGFRICVLDREDSMKAKQEYSKATAYSTAHPSIHLLSLHKYPPRQKQSSHLDWLCLFRAFPCTRDSLLGQDHADLILHSFKQGFGSRKCTSTIGQNLYLGKRSGQLPVTATPTLGPGEGGEHQYHRDFFNPVFTYPIEKITNQLAALTMTYMNMMDPAIVNVLDLCKPEDSDHFCRVKIVTQGITGSPSLNFAQCTRAKVVQKRRDILHLPLPFCLGFACTPHVDRSDSDIATNETVKKALDNWCHPRDANAVFVKDYLRKWCDRFTIGLPTCCQYEFIGNFQEEDWRKPNITIHQYFICDGLMIAVRITDKMGTYFYGHTFVHCSSVALAVKDGIVYYSDESFRIFAWGKGGR